MPQSTDGRPSETEAPILTPFYLTFGTMYRPAGQARDEYEAHPHWPYADPSGWVTIMATDYLAARRQADLYFGDKFSTVYPPERFDTSSSRRFFPRGQIALITQGAIDVSTPDAPLPRFTIDKPQFHGHKPGDVVAERIEGRLTTSPYAGDETVELFHPGDCAERGKALFEYIFNHDGHVLALEIDWQNPAECATCHISIT